MPQSSQSPLPSIRTRGQKLYTASGETYTRMPMPVSSTQRALIAVLLMVLLLGVAIGAYFYLHRAPLAGPSAGAPPDLLSLLPPDAPVVAYADVAALRKLSTSPLGSVLGLASPGPQADKDYADFVRDAGFDYTRDLDRVIVAAWPSALGASAASPPGGRLVALGDGRFDQRKIEAYTLRTGHIAQENGAHKIYEAPGQSPGQNIFVTFLSSTRIALASDITLLPNPPSGKPQPRNSAIQSRIERVAGAPIFAVAATDALPNSFYAELSGSPQLEKLARSVKSLTLAGKPDGDNFAVALDGECDSMKNAFEISTLLDGFRMIGGAALADPKTRRQMTREQAAFLTALLGEVKVSHQDKWVRLTLNLTPEMLGAPASGSHSASTR